MNPQRFAAGLSAPEQALGAVPGLPPSPVNNARQFSEFQLTLLPGQTVPVSVTGDYVYFQNFSVLPSGGTGLMVQNSSALVSVKDSNNNLFQADAAGKGYSFPSPYSILYISTPAGAPIINVQLYAGFGRVQNDSGLRYAVGLSQLITASISRPNNVGVYAANELVGAATTSRLTFPNVTRFPGGNSVITKGLITKGSSTTANANFSLWLFQAALVPADGSDQTNFSPLLGSAPAFIGIINFTSFVTGGAGSGMAACSVDSIAIPVATDGSTLAVSQGANDGPFFGGTLMGYLICNGAYAPAALEAFNVSLMVDKY